ncbi:MAG: hypothetical protein Q9219_003395 [cf. Caloplaca sp. 3 TL-2023]
MSAITFTTAADPPGIFRHYGKLASFGYSQDMEIDHDLPRPAESSARSDTMDTLLDPKQNPNDQSQAGPTNNAHVLPPKPPVVQEPSLAAEPAGSADFAAESSSQEAPKSADVPHLQQDLLALFELTPLADTVARTDPNTGEKINKMRKSYEGKVKHFGLAGKNRAVKHNHEKSMGLLQMAQWPAEEWYSQKVYGRDVRDGLAKATLQKLGPAMHMKPGGLQESDEEKWAELLGIEMAKPFPPTLEIRSEKTGRNESHVKGSIQLNGIRKQSDRMPITEANRPKRAGKKRRYDEHSFEGYGEGFLDDETETLGDAGGYSSDDGSRRGGTLKKRRKVTLLDIRPLPLAAQLTLIHSGIHTRQSTNHA